MAVWVNVCMTDVCMYMYVVHVAMSYVHQFTQLVVHNPCFCPDSSSSTSEHRTTTKYAHKHIALYQDHITFVCRTDCYQ